MQCPIEDVLFGGAVGGGKSDGLLGDFLWQALQYPGHARGILFRRSFPELEELITRSREIYDRAGWTFKEKDRTWYSPEGDTLKMRFIERADDWTKYWGHQYTWQGFDEAGNWPDPTPIDKLWARLRSPNGVPCKRRLTANPGGAGQGWIKSRYIDPAPPMTPFLAPVGKRVDGSAVTVQRVFIPSKLVDNKILLNSDPDYANRLYAAGSESVVRAWLEGDWSVTLGQFFTEWNPDIHVIPTAEIPRHWTKFRAFDWGSKTPFCVLWIAVSDGSPLGMRSYPPGALIVYREWYGARANGEGLEFSADEVAKGILMKDAGERIDYSVADYQIFRADGGPSIAEVMRRSGVYFRAADKERKAGWQQLRLRLKGSRYGHADHAPMLYVMEECKNLIRTLPQMQHSEKDPEDVMKVKGIEDHAPETLRYGCMSRPYTRHDPFPVKKPGFNVRELKRARVTESSRLNGY